jgi:hypothetical protein
MTKTPPRQVALCLLAALSVACLLVVACAVNRVNTHAQVTIVTRWTAETQMLRALRKGSPTADALLAIARNDLATPLTIAIGGPLEATKSQVRMHAATSMRNSSSAGESYGRHTWWSCREVDGLASKLSRIRRTRAADIMPPLKNTGVCLLYSRQASS